MKTLCFTLFVLISSITLSQFTLSNEKMIGGVLDDNLSFKHFVGNSIFYFGNSNSPASGNKSDDSFGQNDLLWNVHVLDNSFMIIATSFSTSTGVGNATFNNYGSSDV
jgi:hypothetical protein